jgi:RND superfamily putative drug exporter
VLQRIASLTWRYPKTVLAAVLVLVLASFGFARDVEQHLKAAGFIDDASESSRATDSLRDALGYDPDAGIALVVRAPGGGALVLSDPAVRKEINRLSAAVAGVEDVGFVSNPLDPRSGAPLIEPDRGSVLITGHLSTPDVEEEGGNAAEEAKKAIGDSSLDVAMGGYAPSFNEVEEQTREDLTKAELIAFPILALLLLIVFRGVIAASIPLLIGVLSIGLTFGVLKLMSGIVDTSLFALNITTGLSLGLAVDYSLLMVSRYREELERHGPTREAHAITVRTAGRAALFSGATVAVALAPLVLMPQRFLYSLGVAGATVGICSAVLAILVVPAILRLTGPRINSLAIRRGSSVSDASDGWYRLARGVMDRPVTVLVASSALLLICAAPLLGTTLIGPSAQAVPPGKESFEANAYIEKSYGRGVTEGVTVTVSGPADPAKLSALDSRIRRIEGVRSGSGFAPAGADLSYSTFALDAFALSGGSQTAVERIRELDGDALLVSGNTARFLDQKASLREHAPLVIALVAAAMFVLLFMLTGSILLPIKTLLMNLLTLAATLGLLVLAFEEGWLQGPFGYQGPEALELISLVFLFAVIFGLATDYAVLVLARIKEVRDAGASNEEAVAIGISRTGRVITAAAVMIAVVFLAFAVSPVFFMKQIALGMALGVLIDATIVRALIVPSLMRLFGEWNWWAPGPLRRFHWRFGLRESEQTGA